MKLPMLSFEEALARLESAAEPPTATETLDLAAAHGRVLAADLRSSLFVPPHDNSGMDGYAVRCADVPAEGTGIVDPTMRPMPTQERNVPPTRELRGREWLERRDPFDRPRRVWNYLEP